MDANRGGAALECAAAFRAGGDAGALASKVVRDEIRLARQEGKTVSPVKGPGLGDLNTLPRWLGRVYDLDLIEHRNTLMRVLAGPSKPPACR